MEDSIARKLAVPKKLSAWEREKQAAEAKKQRQDAENAAALRDFQKSLGVDSDEDFPPSSGRDRRAPHSSRGGSDRHQPPTRHAPSFPRGPGKPRSGPGSLGAVDGHDPPPNLKRKRALDEAKEQNRRFEEDDLSTTTHSEHPYDRSRDAEPDPSYDLPKPTVYLQAFPPTMTPDELKALLAPHLKVHSIRFQDRQRHASSRKPTAVATLTPDTNLTQIENAIKLLNNSYLSCGYRMSMSRFDESSFNAHSSTSKRPAGPFGAHAADAPAHAFSMRSAPPPEEHYGGRRAHSDRRGYAPRRQTVEVKVDLPLDICTIQAIHTIADQLLSEPDVDRAMELEALLMKLPEVQSDEKFSFLFDSTSPAGVYYRHCLWGQELVEEERKPGQTGELIHDDTDLIWNTTTQGTAFSNLTELSQVVTDIDYVSSEDESDNEDDKPRQPDRPEPENLLAETERNFLLPLQHARLTHLLARLPTVNTRLRRGDVARVTNFAINHAGKGAEQIVDKILLNVDMPFATTAAAKYETADTDVDDDDGVSIVDSPGHDEEDYEPHDPAAATNRSDEPRTDRHARQDDPSGAKLVALYVISDILSASATAGARNAWKYRQLFESGFKRQKTFEKLGSIDRELGWGRMKMDHWRRKLAAIFDLWEGWSVFSTEAMQTFRRSFSQESDQEQEQQQVGQVSAADAEPRKPKWMTTVKTIDRDNVNARHGQSEDSIHLKPLSIEDANTEAGTVTATPVDVRSRPDESTQPNDTPQATRSDDPSALSANIADRKETSAVTTQELDASIPAPSKQTATVHAPVPKRRMRAEDMFADSDEEAT